MREVYITNAKRTAIGSFMGSLSTISAIKLGERVLRNLIEESAIDPSYISEVIMGQVLTGSLGQNPARQASINASIPNHVPAFTVNKVCGSGLKAILLGASAIACGDGEMIIAGGQENMSLASHAIYMRSPIKAGDAKMIDMMMYDGLTDAFSNTPMGITAENVANRFNISRTEQDEFAYLSHTKAAIAQKEGRFAKEIVPIEVSFKKEIITFDKDEFIRPDTNIDILSKLKPAFIKDGSVTAGNSSGINDGAAAVILASAEMVKKFNLTPIARIVSYASSGVDPDIMGIGPISSSKKALSKASWEISDLDLIEINEAFASQACYVNKTMGFNKDKVNVNGGAIALGHPIGASGARVLVTLLHEMQRRRAMKGLASLCIGGGMGISICVELV